jgi:hypothetical protein
VPDLSGEAGWHKAALKMNEKWGTLIQVVMAMMYQESSFVHDAQPPMQYFLFIPTGGPVRLRLCPGQR